MRCIYHKFLKIQHPVSLGSVLTKKLSHLLTLKQSNFLWLPSNNNLIHITGNRPEKIQDFIDINLSVGLPVNALKHLCVLILQNEKSRIFRRVLFDV